MTDIFNSFFRGFEPPVTGITGSPLDRADHLRRDPEQVQQMQASATARWLVLDSLKPVVTDDDRLFWATADDLPEAAPMVFLGLDSDGAPRFAASASAIPLLARHGGRVIDARSAAMLMPPGQAAILAQARSLLDWHARHGHCAVCGAATAPTKAGYCRQCPACGAEHFPRTDPVVIMLAIKGDHALVGRQPGFPPRMFSALAGFVEPGESLEEAVAREIFEEAGIRTGRVRYLASQPWPFPSSLMIACLAEALGHEIALDTEELEEARWVSKDEVRAALAGEGAWLAPPPMAIAHTLLASWAKG
ncbi:NAD(+) diphosphatase [Polymorphobacter sp.]|uniref:NAD(+) diphosphatase n=1 Tax=Polymorphobacter sp. TaxID=1909290 RepID=UPI003F713F4B